jgi:hypothetical protein
VVRAHTLYERYESIRRAYRLVPQLRSVALDPDAYVTPVDMAGYVRRAYAANADLFNFQLYSQIQQFLKPEPAPCAFRPQASSLAAPAAGSNLAGGVLRRGVKLRIRGSLRGCSRTCCSAISTCGGVTARGFLAAMAGRGWAMPAPGVPAPRTEISANIRRQFVDRCGAAAAPGQFVELLIDNFRVNFPMLYLEGMHGFVPIAWRRGRLHRKWRLGRPHGHSTNRSSSSRRSTVTRACAVAPLERFSRGLVDRWLTFCWRDCRGSGNRARAARALCPSSPIA